MENQLNTCEVKNYVPISKLKFHPKNQEIRTITRERLDDLKESIREKGFYEPILVWKKGGVVLAGEHRTRAALELIDEGFEFKTPAGKTNELPVVIEDCDAATANQILHESNNHYATWIEHRLAREIKSAEEAGENLRQFGYTQDEIDKMMASAMKDIEEDLKVQVEEDDTSDIIDRDIDKEKYESLVLPAEVYKDLMSVLGRVARSINPEWVTGDSVVEATSAMCESIRKAGFLEGLDEKVKEEIEEQEETEDSGE